MILLRNEGRATMALLAKLYDNGRAAERHPLEADATLRGDDQAPVDVLVADLSATGCLFVCAAPIEPDARVTIGIAGVGRREARIVRSMGSRYGCVFSDALTEAEIEAARDAPGGTIVRFPAWSTGQSPDDESDQPTVGRLSGPVRLAVLAGAGAAGWMALIAALSWLR